MMARQRDLPPRLARWLLQRSLAGRTRSAVLGDLDEEFAAFILPRRGRRGARRWYWRQAILSIVACLREPAEMELEPAERLKLSEILLRDRPGVFADIRAAVRFCWRSPLLSTTVVLTLALGIGVNTAVFSVLNASYFKTLPIAHPDRLVSIDSKNRGSFSYPEYQNLRDLPGLAALVAGGRTTTILGSPREKPKPMERVVIEMVSPNYFDAINVSGAVRGRLFSERDGAANAPPIVVVSDAGWRNRFSADPAVVGTTVRLHRGLFTIVGVAPARFSGLQIGYSPDFWVPLTQASSIDGNVQMLGDRSFWLGLAGVLERAGTESTVRKALDNRWRAEGRDDASEVRLIPRGHEWYAPAPEGRLRLIALFTILILAIACLNVSTLFSTTVHERQKELAIRASLGAGRPRLLRQLLAEHVLLAAVAGVLGGFLGSSLAHALAPAMASEFTPGDLDVTADVTVVVFTFVLSVLAAASVGVLPALRWSQVNPLSTLQSNASGTGRRFGSSALWFLIPWQVALGTVLLGSAGLLVKTVQQLKLGIQATAPERVWFADLKSDSVGQSAARIDDFQTRFRRHLATVPGVEAVGLGSGRPLVSLRRGPLRVEGMTTVPDTKPMPWGPPPPPPPRGTVGPPIRLWLVSPNYVTPGYFAALALPMRRGRDFTDADGARAPRVAIVNETLAQRAFGESNPIGRRIAFSPIGPFDIEIVGVVRDLRYEHLREAAPDGIFFPLAQIPKGETDARTATGGDEPMDLTAMIRMREGQRMTRDLLLQQTLQFDAELFVDRIRTFDEEADGALSEERVLAGLGSLLGMAALALIVVGLYGTMTAAVIRSRRELGIRLALGARPRSLRIMVVTRCVAVAIAGLVVGLPLAYGATKTFAHLLYGVEPLDPLVSIVTIAVVLGTALAAASVPAWRASRVDPVIALRAE